MVEYRFWNPRNHEKISIKKWLYLRYVYHHSIEEIGRGMKKQCHYMFLLKIKKTPVIPYVSILKAPKTQCHYMFLLKIRKELMSFHMFLLDSIGSYWCSRNYMHSLNLHDFFKFCRKFTNTQTQKYWNIPGRKS